MMRPPTSGAICTSVASTCPDTRPAAAGAFSRQALNVIAATRQKPRSSLSYVSLHFRRLSTLRTWVDSGLVDFPDLPREHPLRHHLQMPHQRVRIGFWNVDVPHGLDARTDRAAARNISSGAMMVKCASAG